MSPRPHLRNFLPNPDEVTWMMIRHRGSRYGDVAGSPYQPKALARWIYETAASHRRKCDRTVGGRDDRLRREGDVVAVRHALCCCPYRRRMATASDRSPIQRAARGRTEAPYSSPLNGEHRHGVFSCAGCALHLYSSDAKFDSGTGWPSFWKVMDNAVLERSDTSLGMMRNEVLCSQCGGHLGHVFDDGPRPTGLRYCMNGVAMTFAAI